MQAMRLSCKRSWMDREKGKQMRKIFGVILEWLLTIASILFLFWLIFCLNAFFNGAQAREPAIVKVIGTPSALRPIESSYVRWHRCWDWCE